MLVGSSLRKLASDVVKMLRRSGNEGGERMSHSPDFSCPETGRLGLLRSGRGNKCILQIVPVGASAPEEVGAAGKPHEITDPLHIHP